MSLKLEHSKVAFVDTCLSEDNQQVVLNLPIKQINSDNLPGVSIVVVTRNRKSFANIIINNWKRIHYPPDKLELVIVDDSDEPKKGPILELKALKDSRISYHYINPEQNEKYKNDLINRLENESKENTEKTEIAVNKDSEKESNINEENSNKKQTVYDLSRFRTIGYKRNYGVNVAKYDYICMMDDDDFFYDESILGRVASLLSYKKGCVYSDTIGIYNIKYESSYTNYYENSLCEGSMLFTKDFWKNTKFLETNNNEGINMLAGRELDIIRIPWIFNIIAICGQHNLSGKTKRNLKKKADSNNLFKTFPETFRKVLKSL